jgi:predicted transposase/invertase (TIGR01784 family)
MQHRNIRYLDPKSDVVFKKIFAGHKPILISFLNAIMPFQSTSEHIADLEYLPVELAPDIIGLKNSIVDVRCRDNSGRYFIIEMQIAWSHRFKQRMLFNGSKAYVSQLHKGEDYRYLQPVYGIALLGENYDPSPEYYHHYKIANIKNTEQVIKGLEFVFVELKKFADLPEHTSALKDLWLRFLSEIDETSNTVDAALLRVPEIQRAVHLSEQAAYSSKELEAYDYYWDMVRTEKTAVLDAKSEGLAEGRVIGLEEGLAEGHATGHAEGLAEGLAQGILEGKRLMIRQLLASGVSKEQVANIANVPLEELESL